MRHSEFIALASAAALGVGALVFGRYIASEIETGLADRTREKLAVIGYPELDVDVDGMVLELSGRIKTEKDREILLATLESMSGVDAVVDNLVLVSPLVELQPASLYVQKDAEAMTLSGEAPNAEARDLLAARADLGRGDAGFYNLMKAQDRRAADDWIAAAEAAIDAVSALRVGQASVERGAVRVVGAAPDAQAKDRIAAKLRSRIGGAFSLSVEITAPPPLLSPYVFSARKTDAQGLEITRCAAPDAQRRSVILGELKSRGARSSDVTAVSEICVIANGAPNEQWTDAIARALWALEPMIEGEVRIVDDRAVIDGFLGEDADIAAAEVEAASGWPAAYAVETHLRAEPPVADPFVLNAVKRPTSARVFGYVPSRDRGDQWSGLIEAENELAIARGAPTGWVEAVDVLIEALADLPVGAAKVDGVEATLAAPGDERDRAILQDRLSAAMPPNFSVTVVEAHDPTPASAEAAAEDSAAAVALDRSIYSFMATLTDDGAVAMSGVVGDESERRQVSAIARAKLGGDGMSETLVVGEVAAPLGWQTGLFAGLSALSGLETGELVVKPGEIMLRGAAVDLEQMATVTAELKADAPAEFESRIELAVAAPPAEPTPAALAPLTPEACVAALNEAVMAEPIRFPTGREEIDTSSYPTVLRLIEIARRCPSARLEVGAHTDSGGSDELNLDLSERRATHVRWSMIQEDGVAPERLVAKGYGETEPIADNGTNAGRAKNRRVEFKLLK